MTLVIGYGNTTRSDDGVGVQVAEKISGLGLPGVEVRTAHQLPLDWVEDFPRYEQIFLIDAANDGPPYVVSRITGENASSGVFSHRVDPDFIFSLAAKFSLKVPPVYLCRIQGENFGFGTTLSLKTSERAERVFKEILSIIHVDVESVS